MSLKNTSTSWGWPARLLHWVMALMILALLGVGTYMTGLDPFDPDRYRLTQTHKSVGFTVFILALIRVGWRAVNPSPALPAGMPRWQKAASHASHHLLYLLILAIPLTGWLMVTASPLNDPDNYPVQVRNMVWGLFEMPDLFPASNAALSEAFALAHSLSTKALAALLLVHVAAALKHHFVEKDTILTRMIKG